MPRRIRNVPSADRVRSRRSGRHQLPCCPATGKARFRERVQAKDALKEAARSRARAAMAGVVCWRQEVRAYRCPACRGWHLTSWAQPPAGFAALPASVSTPAVA